MAKKKSRFHKTKKNPTPEIQEADLDRFAGSSDEEADHHDEEEEEDKEEPRATKRSAEIKINHDADDEESSEEEEAPMNEPGRESDGDNDNEEGRAKKKKDRPFVTNSAADPDEDMEPAEKMAGVMARILGAATNTSVVLAKTTTPLQRLQQQEKAKQKALKEKRQENRERNLAALHIPLSVATSQPIGEGRSSITKELEQERFHRRVATRGVVALFNAISQHQHSTEGEEVAKSKAEPSKMTKHGFLDKIKNAAATIDSKKVEDKVQAGNTNTANKRKEQASNSKWDALKDDFMMKPKKNWDEESSDEEGSDTHEIQDISDDDGEEVAVKENKRRKVNAAG